MTKYNDIGISSQLEWPRITHLFRIGILGALITFVSDMLLGWGVEDASLTGFARAASVYTDISDGALFVVALLGLIGIPLEGLSYFGIYKLIASRSSKLAHSYRAGIFGYMLFGACGLHVPACALVYLAKHSLEEQLVIKFAAYFVLPATVLFAISFFVLSISQLKAFLKGCTPYPKWCAVFSLLLGFVLALVLNVLSQYAWANAVSCAWISIGNLWMFGGLLANAKKAQEKG